MLFNFVFNRFYAVFSLRSLGNFYSFSVDIIVLFFLVGSCTFGMYTLCSVSIFYLFFIIIIYYFLFFYFFNIFIFKR